MVREGPLGNPDRYIKEAYMIRKAKAVWRGTGRAGSGNLSTDSGVLEGTPYSFRTRFGEPGRKFYLHQPWLAITGQ
jgi:hypothetical protein